MTKIERVLKAAEGVIERRAANLYWLYESIKELEKACRAARRAVKRNGRGGK